MNQPVHSDHKSQQDQQTPEDLIHAVSKKQIKTTKHKKLFASSETNMETPTMMFLDDNLTYGQWLT